MLLSGLYGFYSALLTERQREIFELYYQNDLSFSEIAENTGVSRPAVCDALMRVEKKMRDYEDKLNLYGKFNNSMKTVEKIDDFLENAVKSGKISLNEKDFIDKAIEEIL